MGDWIQSYKGKGPWTCEPVIKNEYDEGDRTETVLNPVWKDDPTGPTTRKLHKPCGYWPRLPYVPQYFPCIEFITQQTFSDVPQNNGSYISTDVMFYHSDGFLYLGAYNNGTLYKVDPNDLSIIVTTTFNDADVSAFNQILYYDGYIYALVDRTGPQGMWIQKISIPSGSEPFSLVGPPMWAGSAMYGSDGHVYGAMVSMVYVVEFLPPMADFWAPLGDSYSYHVEPTFGSGGTVSGSRLINFRIDPANGFIFNNGPSSSSGWSSAYISLFDFTGRRITRFSNNTTYGPNELVQGTDATKVATLRTAAAFSGLTMRLVDVDASPESSVDYPLLPLKGPDGTDKDASIYHQRTIWWQPNNRIYSAHNQWVDTWGRVVAVNPVNGTVLHQFTREGYVESIGILGNFVYAWWNDSTGLYPTADSYIIKLTLDLQFVCQVKCEGIYSNPTSNEVGRTIVSDGVEYLFNWQGHLLTKYWISPLWE